MYIAKSELQKVVIRSARIPEYRRARCEAFLEHYFDMFLVVNFKHYLLQVIFLPW